MEVEEQLDIPSEVAPAKTKSRVSGCVIALLVSLLLIVVVWFLARPGVFTVQPIGALPEGITIIYHSRGPQMPLFSSPDGLCLELQGSVTLLCRMAALSAVEDMSDRIIVRLPYNEFTYLLSTDGATFDR